MINVYPNQANQFIITARERSLIALSGGSPFYVMELYNQSLATTSYVNPVILSSNTRYDLLELTLTGNTASQNLTAGTIYLHSSTIYDYKIYEQSIVSTTVGLNDKLLESGIMSVSATSTNSIYTTYEGNNSAGYTIYEN